MTLAKMNAVAAEFRDQAGAFLCRRYDTWERNKKVGLLVLSVNGTVTTVDSTIYREWIEAGGCNEILFGNCLDLPALTTVQSINEKAAELKAKWERHALITSVVESNNRFARIKTILSEQFQAQLKEPSDEENMTENDKVTYCKLFQDQLDNVVVREMDDIYGLCLKLVCRSRFFRTEAERILSGIGRIMIENPKADVREAAAMAMIEYVAYWMSTQFNVVPAMT